MQNSAKPKPIKIKPLTSPDTPLADNLNSALKDFLPTHSIFKYHRTIRLSHLDCVRLPLGFREKAARLAKRKKLHLIVITGNNTQNYDQFFAPTTLVMKWRAEPSPEQLLFLWNACQKSFSGCQ
jgi:hypothetical protein